MSKYLIDLTTSHAGNRRLLARTSGVLLVVVACVASPLGAVGLAATSDQTQPLGGCPVGGEWQLVSADVGPVAQQLDAKGNQDGWACKTFVSGSGQVIDNRVQAGAPS
jgi:hypothetical protein